jgi:hypothetical protein
MCGGGLGGGVRKCGVSLVREDGTPETRSVKPRVLVLSGNTRTKGYSGTVPREIRFSR